MPWWNLFQIIIMKKHLRVLKKKSTATQITILPLLKSRLPTGCKLQYHPSGYFLWLKLPGKC